MKKRRKKSLTVFVCVLLMLSALFGCGQNGQTPDNTANNIDKEAASLISQGDYRGAIELYAGLLDDEATHEQAITAIRKAYRDWMLEKAKDINATMDDLLKIPEEMNRRFPETQDYGNDMVVNIGSSYLEQANKESVDKAQEVLSVLQERYAGNEYVCNTLSVNMTSLLYTRIINKINMMVTEGLNDRIYDRDYQTLFSLIDKCGLYEECRDCRKHVEYPIYAWVLQGNGIMVEFENDTLYRRYGERGDDIAETGPGVSISYWKDPQNRAVFVRQTVYGELENGKMTGEYQEMLEISRDDHVLGQTEGTVKEDKFDGVVTGLFTVNSETVPCKITFKEGVPVSLATVNKDGRTWYVVSREDSHDILYSEEEMNSLHGVMPQYSVSY